VNFKGKLNTKLVQFELEASSQKDMFKLLADTQEVFDEETCGLCGSESLKFVVRNVDGNDFHEMLCRKCGARLSFGQSKQKPGSLFPIRKLTPDGRPSRKEGEYGKHRGWTKYRGEQRDDAEEQPARAPARPKK
jgi:hypothetical protein